MRLRIEHDGYYTKVTDAEIGQPVGCVTNLKIKFNALQPPVATMTVTNLIADIIADVEIDEVTYYGKDFLTIGQIQQSCENNKNYDMFIDALRFEAIQRFVLNVELQKQKKIIKDLTDKLEEAYNKNNEKEK